jgi:hypothetical protein
MVGLSRRFFREAVAACVPARNEEEKQEEVSTLHVSEPGVFDEQGSKKPTKNR